LGIGFGFLGFGIVGWVGYGSVGLVAMAGHCGRLMGIFGGWGENGLQCMGLGEMGFEIERTAGGEQRTMDGRRWTAGDGRQAVDGRR